MKKKNEKIGFRFNDFATINDIINDSKKKKKHKQTLKTIALIFIQLKQQYFCQSYCSLSLL